MIIYLNSHDFPDAIYARHATGALSSEVRMIVAQPDWSANFIAQRVIHSEPIVRTAPTTAPPTLQSSRPAISERSIYRLIINSHGYLGYIGIGTGIHIGNLDDLAALRPYFTPLANGGHGVLIDACLVASSMTYTEILTDRGILWDTTRRRVRGDGQCSPTGGYGFLMEMARVLQTKITAGIEIQFSPGRGGADRSSLEGTYIRVFPDGRHQIVVQSY